MLVSCVIWCARLQADAPPGSPTGAHGRGPRLYVGGVPDEITEEDIVEHFNKWGQVLDCYFPGALLCIPRLTTCRDVQEFGRFGGVRAGSSSHLVLPIRPNW